MARDEFRYFADAVFATSSLATAIVLVTITEVTQTLENPERGPGTMAAVWCAFATGINPSSAP